jgi:hypothetical protein
MLRFKGEDISGVGADDSLDAEFEAMPVEAAPKEDAALARLLKQRQEAEDKKGWINAAGAVLQGIADVPTGYEMMYNKKLGNLRPAESLAKVAASIEDPAEKAKKAYEFIKQKREVTMARGADDPTSPDSIATQEQVGGMFPQFAKYVKGKSKAQIMEMMPILSQKARGDEDRALREQEMRLRHADRQDALADKKEAKEQKQKELSASQAKQRGLYESGKMAAEQFDNALKDSPNYDPTSVTEFIDNSEWAPNWMKNKKAVESQAAQSAWVESYLRDASGASIKADERMAYAKDFFPRPGDTPETVANKAALRKQKEENSRVAAGVETGHGPAVAPAGKSKKQLAMEELDRRAKAKKVAGP